MSRISKNDYENCKDVMIPVPDELHLELKLYCVAHKLTMKEVFHEIVCQGIKDRCDE